MDPEPVSHDLKLLTTASAEWDVWLSRVPHDFYHTAGYHRLAEASGEGRAFMAVYGDERRFLVWPYLLRPVSACSGLEESHYTDVGSVYGYPGPLFHNADGGAEFLLSAWRALTENWRSQKAVAVFTRFHPILGNHLALNALQVQNGQSHCCPRMGVTPSGPTVSIDLTLSDDEVVRQYQKILRQEIRTGRRKGLTTEVDEHWQRRDGFIELYHSTMARNRASSLYFFSPRYFDQLRSDLAPHANLFVTRLGERIAAAGVFVEYAGILHAHLAGSNDELKGLSPLKTLLDDVRIWAQRRGNHSMHLGGGRAGKDDSLLAFKSRFSPRRHEFFIGRWVVDSTAYHDLCERRCAYARSANLVPEDEEFFPAYRTHLVPAPGASTPDDLNNS